MINTTLPVAQYVATGRPFQWALVLELLQGTVLFAMDGIGTDLGKLYKYDGEIRYDGVGTYGHIFVAFYNVMSIGPLEQGDVGTQTTVSAVNTRRSQFIAELSNATGELSDMMATEAFVGKDVQLVAAYPGLTREAWPIFFSGEIYHVALDDEKVKIEMRTA